MRIFFLCVFLAVMPAFLSHADTLDQAANQAGQGTDSYDERERAERERMARMGAAYDSLGVTGGQPAHSSPGGLGTFIETIFVLALFIGALYALYRFLQRKRELEGAKGGDTVRILSHQTLGGSKAIEVVEVGRRVFVLGVADSAVSLIAEINDEETLESLRLDHARSETNVSESFMDRLIRGLGRSKQQEQGSISQSKLDYLRAQKDRLSAYKKRQ
jgi:flagellar biogenesis protein FliO